MPNYQLPMGIFDPNSDYARQMAADEEQRQQAAQQIVATMNQSQTPTVQQPAQPQAMPMPNNNGLAAAAASALTPLTMGEQQFASIFKGLKSDYDVAKAANDVAGMQNAHTKAEAYADMAKRFGLDLDRIGRNDSADQLTARLDANRAAILNNISQMVSAPEFYEQQFNKYKAQGVSNGRAREMALNDTEAYEGKYNRIIGDAVPLYGANNKGEMDAIGTVLMNRMYQQSPQSVALYDQYLVNPHDLWKFDKNMEVQDKLYGQKLDYGQHQFDWTRQLNNDKFNFDKWVTEYNGNHQMAMQRMEHEFQHANAQEQMDLFHKDPELFYALRGFGPNGQKNDGGNPTEDELRRAQNIQDIYNGGLTLIDDDVNKAIEELEKKKQKESDPKARKRIEGMKYALNARREAVAWDENGHKGSVENLLKYRDWARDNDAYALIADLQYIFDMAEGKIPTPEQQRMKGVSQQPYMNSTSYTRTNQMG